MARSISSMLQTRQRWQENFMFLFYYLYLKAISMETIVNISKVMNQRVRFDI